MIKKVEWLLQSQLKNTPVSGFISQKMQMDKTEGSNKESSSWRAYKSFQDSPSSELLKVFTAFRGKVH